MQRQDHDHELLQTLACKVRLLTLAQVAATWWSVSAHAQRNAKRRLMQLEAAGFLQQQFVLAEPMLPLNKPIATWRPGQADPDPNILAWKLQSRWPGVAPAEHLAYRTTVLAHREYGGPPRVKPFRSGTITHDLHMSAVYLLIRANRPDVAAAWVGEDLIPKAGFGLSDPDAVIKPNGGRPEWVIEFGGKYDARHVGDFHNDCRDRGRAYELW